jgi:hypothetical protein
MIDGRNASVYVVAETTTTLIERTPIRMAERIALDPQQPPCHASRDLH